MAGPAPAQRRRRRRETAPPTRRRAPRTGLEHPRAGAGMKLLVYGAGVLGSLLAAGMHEAGHDVALLARGERLAALRRHGIQLAEDDSPVVRRVPVPVVEEPADSYDLIAVLVRAHQVGPVLESI